MQELHLNIRKAPGNTLRRQLLQGIRSFALSHRPGTPVPSENAMATRYGLSRCTVGRAYKELEQEGVIYRKRGSGTFVKIRHIDPICYILPAPEIQNRPGFNAETFYGAREKAHELHIPFDSLPATMTNRRADVDPAFFREMPDGTAVVLHGNWFRRIFELLIRKRCRVSFVSSQAEDDYLFDDLMRGWHLVEIDRRGSIRQVIAHLKHQGCRRIAMLHNYPHHLSPFFLGFREALAAEELPFHPELSLFVHSDMAAGYDYLHHLLRLRERYPFDAVVTATLPQTLGALQALREARIEVPRDIALVSLTDHDLLLRNPIPVSVLALPDREAGARAVELLADRTAIPGKRQLPCRFIPRESSLRTNR